MRESGDFDAYLNYRLESWAHWCHDIKRGDVGWPNESIISMMKTSSRNSSPSSKPPFMNESAEEINSLINALQKKHPTYADAIKCYYLERKIPIDKIAKQKNISKSNFMDRVKKGKIWLSGALAQNENT